MILRHCIRVSFRFGWQKLAALPEFLGVEKQSVGDMSSECRTPTDAGLSRALHRASSCGREKIQAAQFLNRIGAEEKPSHGLNEIVTGDTDARPIHPR